MRPIKATSLFIYGLHLEIVHSALVMSKTGFTVLVLFKWLA